MKYIHTKKGNPILLDAKTGNLLYTHSYSDIPLRDKFSKEEVDWVNGDKRIIHNLMTGSHPKNKFHSKPFQKAMSKLEGMVQSTYRNDDAYYIPPLGYKEWDPPIYITGGTGSGKSTFAAKMLEHDLRQRPIWLCTNHQRDDPSLESIFDRTKKVVTDTPIEMINGEPVRMKQVPWNEAKFEKSIVLFDDIGGNPEFIELRNQFLEEGRHMDITVVVLDHNVTPTHQNKKCYLECRTIVLFPSANMPKVMHLLERFYKIPARVRRKMLEESIEDGRYLIYHQSDPMFSATKHSCRLLHFLLNR